MLSQGPRRRRRQRHPHRRRLQPPPRPRLAEDSAAPLPDRTTPTARDPADNQSGLLTADQG